MQPRLSSLTCSSPFTKSGSRVTCWVYLTAGAPFPANAIVTLSASPKDVAIPASVTINAGSTWNIFYLDAGIVQSPQLVTITAEYAGGVVQCQITVNPTDPRLKWISMTPASVYAGGPFAGDIRLDEPAPFDGALVLLSSESAISIPPSVFVPPGATSATFAARSPVDGVPQLMLVWAEYKGDRTFDIVSTEPVATGLRGLSLPTTSIQAGATLPAEVTLDGLAPEGGAVVSLTSSSPAALIPSTVTVPAGLQSTALPITAGESASPQPVKISAFYAGSSRELNFEVGSQELRIGALTLPTASMRPEDKLIGSVSLNGPAPAGGAVIALSSSSGTVTVSSAPQLAAGNHVLHIPLISAAASAPEPVTITASYGGMTAQSVVTVVPPRNPITMPLADLDSKTLQFSPTGKVAGNLWLSCDPIDDMAALNCELFYFTPPFDFKQRVRLISPDGGATFIADSFMPSLTPEAFFVRYWGSTYSHRITSVDLAFTCTPTGTAGDCAVNGTLRVVGRRNPWSADYVVEGPITGNATTQ